MLCKGTLETTFQLTLQGTFKGTLEMTFEGTFEGAYPFGNEGTQGLCYCRGDEVTELREVPVAYRVGGGYSRQQRRREFSVRGRGVGDSCRKVLRRCLSFRSRSFRCLCLLRRLRKTR